MYGDLFQRLLYATRPYEKIEGSAEAIMKKYEKEIFQNCRDGKISTYKKLVKKIVEDYDALPLTDEKKPRVGVVGEILVKYHPDANNNIVDIIEKRRRRGVVLDLVDFFLVRNVQQEIQLRETFGLVYEIQGKPDCDKSRGMVPQAYEKSSQRKQAVLRTFLHRTYG